ncbi:RNA-binding protein [Schizosaccharomyces pombe]|uniref:Uncharacterized RNA-binding protein C365.04c n=1 Tax=Schizosaccharomyces pombe (strain 972 / ATCC 24843) TaxID=284812 RepID=YGR4_SCHPO|nr:putative RNA-binding and ribosome biogenesis protein [Schizosaccharomyces pombe]Q9Y7Y3.1 RecName: Full=Uncharacterized RNA-binding protein C365.04c [Schizosaccharomyces pombe 972h-]CAB44756.1 RNA-binding protein, involved in ribosome biogenesis (predicted) [Schizosaccharomyces pombe]|eukprot:NP_596033.1 putative RNA-binding and ribosome biogenesis protein [Schizosaccharomyces pombe]
MSSKLSKKKLKSLEYRSKKFDKKSQSLEEHEKKVQQKNEELEKKAADKISRDELPEKQLAQSNDKDKHSVSNPPHKTLKSKRQKGKNNDRKVILFVGNLPKDSSVETLQLHFKRAGQVPSVRIPTDKTSGRQKGYAFVEFINPKTDVISKALKFHHTIYKERKINIELTAGGGGKTEARMNKIKEKNRKWKEEMRQRVASEEQQAGEEKMARKAVADEGLESGIHPDRLRLLQ